MRKQINGISNRCLTIKLSLMFIFLLPVYSNAEPPLPRLPNYSQTTQPIVFEDQQLDALIAPIALFPDVLLSHLLIASTYPLEIVQADRWAQENGNLKGQDAINAVIKNDWDPSVKALVAFPQIVKIMSAELEWTQDVGDILLANPKQLLNRIQILRARAFRAGTFEQFDSTHIIKESNSIRVVSNIKNTISVPLYDSRIAFGTWQSSEFPPVNWFKEVRSVDSVFNRTANTYISSSFYYRDCDWTTTTLVDVNKQSYIYKYRYAPSNSSLWTHNPTHRRNLQYQKQYNIALQEYKPVSPVYTANHRTQRASDNTYIQGIATSNDENKKHPNDTAQANKTYYRSRNSMTDSINRFDGYGHTRSTTDEEYSTQVDERNVQKNTPEQQNTVNPITAEKSLRNFFLGLKNPNRKNPNTPKNLENSDIEFLQNRISEENSTQRYLRVQREQQLRDIAQREAINQKERDEQVREDKEREEQRQTAWQEHQRKEQQEKHEEELKQEKIAYENAERARQLEAQAQQAAEAEKIAQERQRVDQTLIDLRRQELNQNAQLLEIKKREYFEREEKEQLFKEPRYREQRDQHDQKNFDRSNENASTNQFHNPREKFEPHNFSDEQQKKSSEPARIETNAITNVSENTAHIIQFSLHEQTEREDRERQQTQQIKDAQETQHSEDILDEQKRIQDETRMKEQAKLAEAEQQKAAQQLKEQ